jgi:nicotinate-nucleotide adenylyltransferase
MSMGMTHDRKLKLGVMGGTFDPIHYGHLVAAQEALWKLGLDQVLFMPAGQPPHKLRLLRTAIEHRLAMVELAIAQNPAFVLSRIDADRVGPAYTVETLSILTQQYGPTAELSLIVGLDTLLDMAHWYQSHQIVSLARIAVVTRPGYSMPDGDHLESLIPGISQRLDFVPIPALDISSSDLRARVQRGQPIKYQLPPAVEDYIYHQGLYKP